MKGKFYWKSLIVCIALPLTVGTLASLMTGNSVLEYAAMEKPPLSPPGWIFPVVWSILYALMGVASWLIWTSEASLPRKRRALSLYAAQLTVNFFWPLIFFNLQLYLVAFFWLLLLLILSAACTVRFYCMEKAAGYLLMPYILWMSFAAYLNLGVYILN